MKFRRRHDIPPFSLDRFHENGGNLFGGYGCSEKGIFNPLDTSQFAPGISEIIGAPIAIGIWNMRDSRNQRVVVFFLDGLAGRKGQCPHCPPMKSPVKGQVQFTLRMPSGQFECGLNRFCAGVPKINLFPAFSRSKA